MDADAPDVPDGVLVQSLALDQHGDWAGYRIYGDGRMQRRPRGGSWIDDAPLDERQLAAVRQVLADDALDGLAPRYDGPSAADQPPVLWLQVARGDGVRSVAVVGDRRVPELERLTARLTEVFRA